MVLVGVSIGRKIALSKDYWCIVTVLDIAIYYYLCALLDFFEFFRELGS